MVRASRLGNGFRKYFVGLLDRLLTRAEPRTSAHMARGTQGCPTPQQLRTGLHTLPANCREYFERPSGTTNAGDRSHGPHEQQRWMAF